MTITVGDMVGTNFGRDTKQVNVTLTEDVPCGDPTTATYIMVFVAQVWPESMVDLPSNLIDRGDVFIDDSVGGGGTVGLPYCSTNFWNGGEAGMDGSVSQLAAAQEGATFNIYPYLILDSLSAGDQIRVFYTSAVANAEYIGVQLVVVTGLDASDPNNPSASNEASTAHGTCTDVPSGSFTFEQLMAFGAMSRPITDTLDWFDPHDSSGGSPWPEQYSINNAAVPVGWMVASGTTLAIPGGASTTSTSGYTQTNVSSTVNVPVVSSVGFSPGDLVKVIGIGIYTVSSVPDGTHLVLTNTGDGSLTCHFGFAFQLYGSPITTTRWSVCSNTADGSGGAFFNPFAAGAGQPYPDSDPVIELQAAEDTECGQAVLTGEVATNAYPDSVDWWFEWGTTTGYGNMTPGGTIPPGCFPVDVSDTISGLTPGVVYHFRLVAQLGSDSPVVGFDATFTQGGCPQPYLHAIFSTV